MAKKNIIYSVQLDTYVYTVLVMAWVAVTDAPLDINEHYVSALKRIQQIKLCLIKKI